MLSHRLSRLVALLALPLAALLLRPGPAAAALDPELKEPYRLKVVLDVARHRLFTPVFTDRLGHNLRDILQADLGDLARVEVVRSHPLLQEIHDKGLDKALDGYRQVSGEKTHFVLVNFAGGRYEIRARQHDGMTGLSSPLVRQDQTSDPLLVARTAAALVSRDFGLVGTVTKVESDTVDIGLKAGGRDVPLKRWVGGGEVFAVAQITRGSRGPRSVPLQWALLQVVRAPHEGVCTCRYYHRFKDEALTDRPDVLGYRCLKLATVKAPLRLRLLDFKPPHEPLDGLQVHVSSGGFTGPPTSKLATDRDGLIPPTDESYAHAAFVTVLSSEKVRAQVPVPMVADRTVDLLVSLDATAEEKGQKELRRDLWVRRVLDSLRVAVDRVKDINELGREGKRKEVLARAEEGLQSMATDLKVLSEERDRLQAEGGLDLSEGDQGIEELRKRQKELDGFVARLGKELRSGKDPKQVEIVAKVEQGGLLEGQAEYGQAISLYEEIVKAHPNQTKVRNRLAALQKAWAIHGKEHGQAREYIYGTWPKLADPEALKEGLKKAREAFDVCRRVNDVLTPQKLLHLTAHHADTLKKHLATLQPQAKEDDRKEAQTIAEVSAGLKQLHEEVAKYLKEKKDLIP